MVFGRTLQVLWGASLQYRGRASTPFFSAAFLSFALGSCSRVPEYNLPHSGVSVHYIINRIKCEVIKAADEHKRLVGDTAYGTGKFLGWLVEAGVTPHIPVWDKSTREDGTFSRSDFKFDKDRNIYICPTGKLLKTTGRVLSGYMLRYTASTRDCGPCPLKSKCCPNSPQRIVPRDVNEDARDHARALMGTPEYERSRDERKKVEMKFAHAKSHHGFKRLRLRGISGARDECHLVATAQNLKTLAKYIWRPPDAAAVCVT
jgi:hypothetical protein